MPTLQHIALNCHDRLAQEAFYTHHFGFHRVRVFNFGQAGEFVMLRLGSVCFALFGTDDSVAARGGEQPVGLKHLAFEVEDIEAKIAALTAAGFEMGRLIDCSPGVPGLRICFFNDPEGNILELMEGWQDELNPPPAPK